MAICSRRQLSWAQRVLHRRHRNTVFMHELPRRFQLPGYAVYNAKVDAMRRRYGRIAYNDINDCCRAAECI